MTTVLSPDEMRQYEALAEQVGVVDHEHRSHVEITGRDRAKFLHYFCTNEIKKLPPGRGCEALVLDAKGAVIEYIQVYCDVDSLLIETCHTGAEWLVRFLDGYRIREAVEFHDRTESWSELLVCGAQAESFLKATLGIALPAERLAHGTVVCDGERVSVRRTDFVRGGLQLVTNRNWQPVLLEKLTSAGAVACTWRVADVLRIEARSPLPGIGFMERTLPQELNGDDRFLNFKKGCYLGQETVARLDALGHVNRLLVVVRFVEPSDPPHGLELLANGQEVGRLTSAGFSPRMGCAIGLAMVRRGHCNAGTRLESACGGVEVGT